MKEKQQQQQGWLIHLCRLDTAIEGQLERYGKVNKAVKDAGSFRRKKEEIGDNKAASFFLSTQSSKRRIDTLVDSRQEKRPRLAGFSRVKTTSFVNSDRRGRRVASRRRHEKGTTNSRGMDDPSSSCFD